MVRSFVAISGLAEVIVHVSACWASHGSAGLTGAMRVAAAAGNNGSAVGVKMGALLRERCQGR